MNINFRVYTKAAAHSPWTFTGIIESDRATAVKVWGEIIRDLRYHAYKLEPIVYGVPIDRRGLKN